jgi:hypothetical protein
LSECFRAARHQLGIGGGALIGAFIGWFIAAADMENSMIKTKKDNKMFTKMQLIYTSAYPHSGGRSSSPACCLFTHPTR